MSGMVGWSPGYQSAGPNASRICVIVKAPELPGRRFSAPSSGAGAAAGGPPARAPGAGAGGGVAGAGPAKPYAQGGGASAADNRTPAVTMASPTITTPVIILMAPPARVVSADASRLVVHPRGGTLNENPPRRNA